MPLRYDPGTFPVNTTSFTGGKISPSSVVDRARAQLRQPYFKVQPFSTTEGYFEPWPRIIIIVIGWRLEIVIFNLRSEHFFSKPNVPRVPIINDPPALRWVDPEASSFNFQDILEVAQDPFL